MAVQRVDIAHDLARLGKLLVVEHAAAHHEADRSARIGGIAADTAIHVFLACDGGQHLARHIIGYVAFEHLAADPFQLHVDFFQRIGAVLDVCIKQLQQQFFGIRNQAGHAACAHARQAKNGHRFIVDGKQDVVVFQFRLVLVEDEGHTLHAWLVKISHQKVGTNVQLAIVAFVETGRFFNVFIDRIVRNGNAVILLDPAHLLIRGVFQIHPDRLELRQLFERFDFFLKQPATGQSKDIEHGRYPLGGVCGAACTHSAGAAPEQSRMAMPSKPGALPAATAWHKQASGK